MTKKMHTKISVYSAMSTFIFKQRERPMQCLADAFDKIYDDT